MAIPLAGDKPLADLAAFLAPFGHLVRRSESREALERYTTGLLSGIERKNAAGLGRSLPRTNSQKLQEFLTRTAWDPAEMDALRVEQMRADAAVGEGVLILDDTGFAKKGRASVGVARQYSGTLGRVDNCQVLVTAHYMDRVFDWPVTARLYLPQSWADDAGRRAKAGVPSAVAFATKGQIALDLVDWSQKAQVPFRWVVVDAGYGDQPALLDGLVERQIPHLVSVSRSIRFRLAEAVAQEVPDESPPAHTGKGRPRKPRTLADRVAAQEAASILEALPIQAWQRVAWRDGRKGPLVKEFARVPVFRTGQRGAHLPVQGWLIGERPIGQTVEGLKLYFVWGLDTVSLEEHVDLAHVRWVIERFYQDAKGELGLDHYEGRRWHGFHRHVALVMLAHCFLTLRQCYGPEVLQEELPAQSRSQRAVRRPRPPRGFPPTGKAKRCGTAAAHS